MKPKTLKTSLPGLLLLTLALMSLGVQDAFAQGAASGGSLGQSGSRSGSAGAAELLVPPTARYTSLGGATIGGLADMSGLEALYANPAGLSLNKGTSAIFSRMEYVADIGVNYMGLAQSIGNSNLAFTLMAWDFGDIPEQTEFAPEISEVTFGVSYFTAGLTYSRQLTDRIAAGATLKLLNESIDDMDASAFAFDAGMTYDVVGTGLRFGVSLKNIGYEMVYGGTGLVRQIRLPNQDPTANNNAVALEAEGFQLPTQLNFGMSYTRPLAGENYVTLLGSFRSNSFDQDQYTGAVELGLMNVLYVRGGYQMTDDLDLTFYQGVTFGAGFKLGLGSSRNLMIDYAYVPTDFFEDIQYFTASVSL